MYTVIERRICVIVCATLNVIHTAVLVGHEENSEAQPFWSTVAVRIHYPNQRVPHSNLRVRTAPVDKFGANTLIWGAVELMRNWMTSKKCACRVRGWNESADCPLLDTELCALTTRIHQFSSHSDMFKPGRHGDGVNPFTPKSDQLSSVSPCSLIRNSITSHSMKNLAFHSLLRWKMFNTTRDSHYLSNTFLFRKVGRMYVLNLGIKGLNDRCQNHDVMLIRL